jgi:hypothetical protein
VWDGRSSQREGGILVLAYGAVVVAFYLAGGT